jgi:hypothetical protein
MSPDKKQELAALAAESWECVSLKPPYCFWPDCGCDPYTTAIIQAMMDDGWEAATTRRKYSLLESQFANCHKEIKQLREALLSTALPSTDNSGAK